MTTKKHHVLDWLEFESMIKPLRVKSHEDIETHKSMIKSWGLNLEFLGTLPMLAGHTGSLINAHAYRVSASHLPNNALVVFMESETDTVGMQVHLYDTLIYVTILNWLKGLKED